MFSVLLSGAGVAPQRGAKKRGAFSDPSRMTQAAGQLPGEGKDKSLDEFAMFTKTVPRSAVSTTISWPRPLSEGDGDGGWPVH